MMQALCSSSRFLPVDWCASTEVSQKIRHEVQVGMALKRTGSLQGEEAEGANGDQVRDDGAKEKEGISQSQLSVCDVNSSEHQSQATKRSTSRLLPVPLNIPAASCKVCSWNVFL